MEKQYMAGQVFLLEDEILVNLARQVSHDLRQGGTSTVSPFALLDSCIGLPTGQEEGVYLALDFGGTNVRASRIRLLGHRGYVIEKIVKKPLRLAGVYDHLSAQETPAGLFDFLAGCIGEAALPGREYVLGHTFSFAAAQEGAADARMTAWSKEAAVPGMEGRLVNEMLQQALVRRGLERIRPKALVNDTTAVLLAAAYCHDSVQAAAICGTGFNVCYYEPATGHIINLEAGNYNRFGGTRWDAVLDDQSEKPGDHTLEKMISGAYLGELFRLWALDYLPAPKLAPFSTAQLNELVTMTDVQAAQRFLASAWSRLIPQTQVEQLQTAAGCLFVRSAQIAGAVCAGVVRHLYPQGALPEQMIGIEGSVMEKVYGSQIVYDQVLQQALSVDDAGQLRQVPVSSSFVVDGASVGAAVAAAMIARL
jgi:hexokinase